MEASRDTCSSTEILPVGCLVTLLTTNLGFTEEKFELKCRRFLFLASAIVLFTILGIVIYAANVRASAQALIDSAKSIHSTADAQREIAIWQRRSRESSWEASTQSQDLIFDTRVDNRLLHYLHICPPTVAALSISIRDGQLRSIILVMFTGSDPNTTPGVWIQEWFDSGTPANFYVKGKDKPWRATVEFSSAVPEAEREQAFALNANCFVKLKGCKNAEEILPNVWQWSLRQQ
jgi:hypothetical protein